MTTPAPALTAVLDELDELRAKATAGGEWEQNETWTRWIDTEEGSLIAEAQSPADAALIVAAVNHLPELTAEVRRGRALREAVEKLIAFYDRHEYSTLNVDDIRAALEAS